MLDIDTRDLLATAEDALAAPTHLTPAQVDVWHNHTLRNRIPVILEALRIAREESDGELAVRLIDQAIHDHPAPTRVPGNRPVAGTVPKHKDSNPGLPVPEHVLCTLLHKHWNMTVEGQVPHETFVARRPLGWTGEGDPYERITAPNRTELLRLLAHRHLGVHRSNPEPPPAA
ncbi:hypothetical protein [Nocardiopsis sp. L17-MgMaSL7]|uniref:hypothetical protein n=1 Tax=Nocardiopsis sp. L17-MgMaSL7 TaxID=1938893 RepID=UPI000D71709A|nr:hypothetical protein [Nocardiopsis sp. L17-MgMaSL7]PWV52841.1 hypothetical protein BDW27_105184 [Nocardiopsis sp. L17-MgMaSL7]